VVCFAQPWPVRRVSLFHPRNGIRATQRPRPGGELLKLKQADPDEVVEKANDLNAPLMPANDDTGFRPLTEEEKENLMSSLGAKGRK
jgi:hypothetical protein